MITGMTMATRSITQAGVYFLGKPAQDYESWNKNYARPGQLDKLVHMLNSLGNQMLGVNRAVRLIKRDRDNLKQARFEKWI